MITQYQEQILLAHFRTHQAFLLICHFDNKLWALPELRMMRQTDTARLFSLETLSCWWSGLGRVNSCDSDHSLNISADQSDLFLLSLTSFDFLLFTMMMRIFPSRSLLFLQTCLSLLPHRKIQDVYNSGQACRSQILDFLPAGPIITTYCSQSIQPTPLESICIHKLGLTQPGVSKWFTHLPRAPTEIHQFENAKIFDKNLQV